MEGGTWEGLFSQTCLCSFSCPPSDRWPNTLKKVWDDPLKSPSAATWHSPLNDPRGGTGTVPFLTWSAETELCSPVWRPTPPHTPPLPSSWSSIIFFLFRLAVYAKSWWFFFSFPPPHYADASGGMPLPRHKCQTWKQQLGKLHLAGKGWLQGIQDWLWNFSILENGRSLQTVVTRASPHPSASHPLPDPCSFKKLSSF